MKRTCIGLVLAIAIFIQPVSTFGEITVGLVEWFPWGTAYVAQEKGFWKNEGLDVRIMQFESYDMENLKAFEHGRIDFGLMMLGNAVEMIAKSPKYAIIYEHDWSHGGDLFIMSKDLKNISDLRGKKIGLYSDSAPVGFFMSKILEKSGLAVNDVSVMEIPNTKALGKAFVSGRMSAMVSYDPEASKTVASGAGKLLFSSADFPGVIPEGLAASLSLIQNDPETVKKFLRGWLNAVKWESMPENHEEFHEILNRTMFKGSNYSNTELQAFEAGGKIHYDLPTILERNETGVPAYTEKITGYLKQKGDKVDTRPGDFVKTAYAIAEAKKIFQ